MVRIYLYRIENGVIKNINDVPKTWRTKVIEALSDDYTISEDGTISKTE